MHKIIALSMDVGSRCDCTGSSGWLLFWMMTNLGGCNGEGFFFQTKQFENVPVKWPARRIKKINVHTRTSNKSKKSSARNSETKKTERWWTTTPNHSAWNHRTRALIHENDKPREDESSKLLFFVVAVSRWYYQQQTKRYRKGNGRSDSTLFQNDSISCGRRLYHSTNHRHGRFTSRERAKNERIRRLGQ